MLVSLSIRKITVVGINKHHQWNKNYRNIAYVYNLDPGNQELEYLETHRAHMMKNTETSRRSMLLEYVETFSLVHRKQPEYKKKQLECIETGC